MTWWGGKVHLKPPHLLGGSGPPPCDLCHMLWREASLIRFTSLSLSQVQAHKDEMLNNALNTMAEQSHQQQLFEAMQQERLNERNRRAKERKDVLLLTRNNRSWIPKFRLD